MMDYFHDSMSCPFVYLNYGDKNFYRLHFQEGSHQDDRDLHQVGKCYLLRFSKIFVFVIKNCSTHLYFVLIISVVFKISSELNIVNSNTTFSK